MTARLNDSRVRALKPRTRRFEITDPSSPGLQLRVETSGAKSWLLRFFWHGKRQRIALGLYPAVTLTQARMEALRARQNLERGIDPRRAERAVTGRHEPAPAVAAVDRHSVANLAREFMEQHVKPHRKRPDYVQRILDSDVLPEWKGRDARTVTPREVVELLDGIVARGSRVMANRVANVLSQLFRFGIHRQLVDASPVQLLYRPGGREKPRDRALTTDELTALLRSMDGLLGVRLAYFGHVVRVLLLTGQRRGELALARWADFNLKGDEPTWSIPAEHSKTGEPHVVPLSPWAVAEMEALRRYARGSRYVLPNSTGKAPASALLLTRNLARVREKLEEAGIPAFTLHDLRRTCRTGLAQLGVDDAVAERVLNHVPEDLRRVYNRHKYADEMRAGLLKWERHLVGLIRRKAAA